MTIFGWLSLLVFGIWGGLATGAYMEHMQHCPMWQAWFLRGAKRITEDRKGMGE